MSIDPYIAGALLMMITLSLCVVIMFVVRDRQWVPAHVVRRTLRCSERSQPATVDFIERTRTGMTVRWVQSCSLWAAGQRCRQECRYGAAADAAAGLGTGAEDAGQYASAALPIGRPDQGRAAEL